MNFSLYEPVEIGKERKNGEVGEGRGEKGSPSPPLFLSLSSQYPRGERAKTQRKRLLRKLLATQITCYADLVELPKSRPKFTLTV